jgi:molybdopterin converting factor small subunit
VDITIECCGVTARLAGGAEHVLRVPPQARVADVLALLAVRWPELGRVLPACACAVGDTVVPRTRPLAAGERLALLPPVSGG